MTSQKNFPLIILLIAFCILISQPLRAEYKDLSPADQELALKNYKAWKTMSEAKQENLETNWSNYQKLTPEEKSKLIQKNDKIKNLSPARKAWLKKKTLKRDSHRDSNRRPKRPSRSRIRRNTA